MGCCALSASSAQVAQLTGPPAVPCQAATARRGGQLLAGRSVPQGLSVQGVLLASFHALLSQENTAQRVLQRQKCVIKDTTALVVLPRSSSAWHILEGEESELTDDKSNVTKC